MMMNNYLQIKRLYLILFGFFFFLIFIWARFLRERQPKVIPYILENDTFLFLLITCLILLITLIMHVLSKIGIINIKETPIEHFIKSCFYELDYFIKNTSLWSEEFLKKQNKIYETLLYLGNKQLKKAKMIYFVFILPKILLPIILFFDIFFFKEIKFFYVSLSFIILPLFFRYILHSLHCYYISLLDNINAHLVVICSTKTTEGLQQEKIINNGVHYYVQEMALYQLKIKKSIEHFSFEFKLNLDDFTSQEKKMFTDDYWKKNLIPLFLFYRTLYVYTKHKNHNDFYVNTFSLSMYFFCWCFILFSANYFAVTFDFLLFLHSFQEIINPFSMLIEKRFI